MAKTYDIRRNITGKVEADVDTSGLATETTLAAIKAQTDQLEFSANKLRTTGEDGGGGGGGPVLIFGTTANLAASATFASGILSLVGKSQVETRVLSDTDGTLVFDFYEDAAGSDLVRNITIPYVGGSEFQYFAAPAFSNYVEYSFINSATPQTDFLYETKVLTTSLNGQIVRLDGTIVSGMVAPVTRSIITGITDTGLYQNTGVTSGGNIKSTLYDSQTNSRQIIDPNGAAKVGEAVILAGDSFYGQALSPFLWQENEVNGGTSTPGIGEQSLETNTGADGEVCVQSVKKARFMIAQFNIAHFGLQLIPAQLLDPNLIIEWGCYNPLDATVDGFLFRVQGDPSGPIWEIVTVKNNVETVIPRANWNGPQLSLFNDAPNLSVYEMIYNAGTVIFTQGPNVIHQLSGLMTPYAGSYNFPVTALIKNINGNTNNNKIGLRAAGIYRLGEERGETIARAFMVDTLVKTGAGYIGKASLSRSGSGGGDGTAIIYDGTDNTGIVIGRLDVGGDDVKGITLDGTFSDGLFIEITGSGTNTLTVNFE